MPRVIWTDFSGGLYLTDTDTSREQAVFKVPENALITANEVEFLPGGAVRGRRGSEVINPTDSLGGECQVVKMYYPRAYGGIVDKSGQGWAVPRASGDIAWQNLGGIENATDGARAVVKLGATESSELLVAYGFFRDEPLPLNSVVTDVKVIVYQARLSGASISLIPVTTSIRLTFDRSQTEPPVQGANLFDQGRDSAGGSVLSWPAINTGVTYYDSGDPRWGYDANELDPVAVNQGVNNPLFGVEIQVADTGFGTAGAADNWAECYYVSMQVTYQPKAAKLLVAGFHEPVGGDLVYRYFNESSAKFVELGTIAASPAPGEPTDGGGRMPINPFGFYPKAIMWPEKQKIFFWDGHNPVKWYAGEAVDGSGNPIPRDDVMQDVEKQNHTDSGFLVVGALDPPKGPFAALHKNRLYATTPEEIQYSVYACDVLREGLWRPDVHLSVNDELGGTITGLESFGDTLLIFKDTSIWSFLGDPDPVNQAGQLTWIGPVGCVAPRSIAITPIGIVYMGRDGIYLTGGGPPTKMSSALDALFTARTQDNVYTEAIGVYYHKRQQYWLKLNPADSDIYVAHVVGDGLVWSRIAFGEMTCGTSLEGQDDMGELMLGTPGGFVSRRDVGDQDGLSIPGVGLHWVDISPQVETGERQMDAQFRRLGRVHEGKILARSKSPLSLTVAYDQRPQDDGYNVSLPMGETTDPSEFQEPRFYVRDKVQFGRFVRLGLQVQGPGGPEFELHRVDLEFRMRGSKVWRR